MVKTEQVKRIVITGMGTLNPLAHDVPSYWEGLKKGKSVIRQLQHTDLSSYHARIGGEVDYPENIRDYFKRPKMIQTAGPEYCFCPCFRDAGR